MEFYENYNNEFAFPIIECLKQWIAIGFESNEEKNIIPLIRSFLLQIESVFPSRSKELQAMLSMKIEKVQHLRSDDYAANFFSELSNCDLVFNETPLTIAKALDRLERTSFKILKKFDIVDHLFNKRKIEIFTQQVRTNGVMKIKIPFLNNTCL